MPYNSIISRADAQALIPEEVSYEILKGVTETSAAMRLARRLQNMSRGQMRLPVASALATAYFVASDNGLKQTSEVNWANKYIDAEEIAVIVPISTAVLDDADYDIWGESKKSIIEAFGLVIDQALFFGTGIPASWTTNLGSAGLKAGCVAKSQSYSVAAYADMYEAVLGEKKDGTKGVYMAVEANGFMVSGNVAHASMRGKLRNARSADGVPLLTSAIQDKTQYVLDGAPIVFPLNGSMDATSALMFSGEWSQLVYSMRQDITWKILDQAVITDNNGAIVYNLAQQDMVALRAVMRVGFALPNPVNRMNTNDATRYPFAALTA